MTTFQPGDVCLATVRGVPNVRVMWDGSHGWMHTTTGEGAQWTREGRVTDIRPCVVIPDPATTAPADIAATLRAAGADVVVLPAPAARVHVADCRLVKFRPHSHVLAEVERQTTPPPPPPVTDARARELVGAAASTALLTPAEWDELRRWAEQDET